MNSCLHHFTHSICRNELPSLFNCPFHYSPHPLCLEASRIVQHYLATRSDWHTELAHGKMFGVLVVETQEGQIGFLAAFSGNLAGSNQHEFFVPPVYDLLDPNGFFRQEEQEISNINSRIIQLENSETISELRKKLKESIENADIQLAAVRTDMRTSKILRDQKRQSADKQTIEQLNRESQFQKAEYKRLEQRLHQNSANIQQELDSYQNAIEQLKQERKQRSAALQQRLFRHFVLLNAHGVAKDLCEIFKNTPQQVPPAGSGECAAPKLLQYAYSNRMRPVCMAEFWWGNSPKQSIRHHGTFYPSCQSKCGPILAHMLQGLPTEENPLTAPSDFQSELETLYEDPYLIVVNKPAGILSVPGRCGQFSVWQYVSERYPEASGPLTVHRLDMSTSGILVLAKDKLTHQNLQAQFEKRTVRKRYTALLEGILPTDKGIIRLPLSPDFDDRPRQRVDLEHGKIAVTRYQAVSFNDHYTRVHFWPLTGRTHQLRVHAAHPDGLGCPIVGDELYGHKAERLYLHADYLEFRHPVTGQICRISCPAPF